MNGTDPAMVGVDWTGCTVVVHGSPDGVEITCPCGWRLLRAATPHPDGSMPESVALAHTHAATHAGDVYRLVWEGPEITHQGAA